MAEWFRSWHGAARDPKIAIAAKKAGVPRAVAIAVWWDLLDIASQADDRGDISGADPEVMAFALDIDEDQVRAVLSAFDARGMIGAGRIVAWQKRQPKREDDTVSDRVREWRKRQKGDVPERDEALQRDMKRDETQRNAPEESRAEKSREEQSSAQARARVVGLRCLGLIGRADDPTTNWAPVHQWLADGADPERHVFPTIERIVASGKTPRNLAYFTAAIAEAVAADRETQTDAARAAEYRRDTERTRLGVYRDMGQWLPSWGPKPETGHCRYSPEILAEFGFRQPHTEAA